MKKSPAKWLLPVMVIAASLFLLSACEKTDNNDQPSRLDIYLTDAPADYQAVWIDIREVKVKASNDTSGEGWVDVPLLRPGAYDLLDLRNGRDTILGGVTLPAGKISQIRLVLGDDNKLVLEDGSEVPLKTPSGQESGLKLNIGATLVAGVPYALVLDFDAARSIVRAGNSGQFLLKPVIRTFAKEAGGAIEGVVLPDSAHAHVIAVSATDTLETTPEDNGSYKLWGLPIGDYTLAFIPDTATLYKSDTLQNINVTIGNVTTVDTVRLVQ